MDVFDHFKCFSNLSTKLWIFGQCVFGRKDLDGRESPLPRNSEYTLSRSLKIQQEYVLKIEISKMVVTYLDNSEQLYEFL